VQHVVALWALYPIFIKNARSISRMYIGKHKNHKMLFVIPSELCIFHSADGVLVISCTCAIYTKNTCKNYEKCHQVFSLCKVKTPDSISSVFMLVLKQNWLNFQPFLLRKKYFNDFAIS